MLVSPQFRRTPHTRPQWHSLHVGVAPGSAHPSHFSLPHLEFPPKGPSRAVRMCASPPFRYTPHAFRGSMGSFITEGANGSVQTWASPPFRHTLGVFRGPIWGAPPKAPVAVLTCGRHTLFGPPLTRFVAA